MLRQAYAKAVDSKQDIVDDAQAVELAGGIVKICETDKFNIKITVPEDLIITAAVLKL
jgi:2-C-methyl-D-erythritol 4-phosphate cytidylyltransferase